MSHHSTKPTSPFTSTEGRVTSRAELLMSALLAQVPLTSKQIAHLTHPMVIATALHEGVAGALFNLISHWSEPVFSERSRALLLHAQLRDVWLEEARLSALAHHWSDALPTPLLIKGASYSPKVAGSRALWGEGERSSSDLDMLIPLNVEQLSAALPVHLGATSPLRPARTLKKTACIPLSFNNLLIECHIAVAPPHLWPTEGPLSTGEIWSRGIPTPVSVSTHDGPRLYLVRRPTANDQLIIALAQLLKGGGGARLRDWLDLTKLLIHPKTNPMLIYRSAACQQIGLDKALAFAFMRLQNTPAKAYLPQELSYCTTEHPHIAHSIKPLAHPLSGVTPNLCERAYIRALLSAPRPHP